MFGSLAELLDWSERYGVRPVVYKGPEGSARGSVEVSKDLPAPIPTDNEAQGGREP
jgi:hypothetical protein